MDFNEIFRVVFSLQTGFPSDPAGARGNATLIQKVVDLLFDERGGFSVRKRGVDIAEDAHHIGRDPLWKNAVVIGAFDDFF